MDNWISTENDRVAFLKVVAQAMATKARIRLNLKRLYSANGYAVKELLKIASVLKSANEHVSTEGDIKSDGLAHSEAGEDSDTAKAIDVHETRRLASEVTQRGALLHDLLSEEEKLRSARQNALARPLDVTEVEAHINTATEAVEESIKRTEEAISESSKDEKNLEAKLEKRKAELERTEKRLESLKKVRPQYMDEYEKLQDELQELYDTYIERQRNLHYIEAEVSRHESEERRRMEESERALRSMQKRLKDEELSMLRGDHQLEEDGNDPTLEAATPSVRPGSARSAAANCNARTRAREQEARGSYTRVQRARTQTHRKVQGSLLGASEDDEDDVALAGDADDAVVEGDTDGAFSTRDAEDDGALTDEVEDDDDDDGREGVRVSSDDEGSEESSDNDF